ncbi:MAG: hypothetical protein HYT28_02380 [Parcubacteria group bacterium]|nr:hypothetical protein [Parcubacteria group bacterium]
MDIGVWTSVTRTLTGAGLDSGSLATQSYIDTATSTLSAKIQSGSTVTLSDFGATTPNTAYKAKLQVLNQATVPTDADSLPTVVITDSAGTVQVNGSVMTKDSNGTYSFSYSLGGNPVGGVWETVVSVVINGQTVRVNDYWEVASAPAQVIVNSITDHTIPSITANVTITNEGSSAFEYHYEWCVVKEQNNPCGDGDDIDYASAAKFIQPGEDFITDLSLTLNQEGIFYFKVAVTWGTKKSFASSQFDARGFTVSGDTFVRLETNEATSSPFVTDEGSTITQGIPDGATNEASNFHISRLSKTDVLASFAAPSGKTALGSYIFGLRASTVASGTTITLFNKPITVTFEYDESLLGGLDESALQIYHNLENGSGWIALDNQSINTTSNIITGQTMRFSLFGVFGSEVAQSPSPSPSPAPSSGGGGGGGGGGSGAAAPSQPAAVITSKAENSADFNGDNKVNSVDFSILLFFWKTSPPFANPGVDINKDGKVDSVDFSILLYHWNK